MTPNEAAGTAERRADATDTEASWPDMERHLDGVTMCRSVSLYAMRGWFDAAVELAVARAVHHQWDRDEAASHAIDRLCETLHTAADTLADLKRSAGAEARIQ